MYKYVYNIFGGLILLCALFFIYSYIYAGDKSENIVIASSYSTCVDCHRGIEQVSDNHDIPCVDCHRGDNLEKDKDKSHIGMLGGRNPSSPDTWDIACKNCHQYQVDRVKTTIMFTNTGMIKNTMLAWDKFDEEKYGTRELESYDENGVKINLKPVKDLNNIAGEVYRKFCSGCHIGYDRWWGYRSHHSSGCAACHYTHTAKGVYEGGDEQLKGKKGYPVSHALNKLPPDDVCFRCHNRSGRISLSYEGLVDGNNSLVPTDGVLPGPGLISGIRNAYHIKADIHKEFGMECIDCHTSRDIMGDGYVYENMYNQTEILCEDCHGTYTKLPLYEKIVQENDSALIESRNYSVKMEYGMDMVLTSKGSKYSNVFYDKGKYFLATKRKGEILEIKTITGSDEHTIVGHEKLECYTCHSQAVPQCYGCHTTYDERKQMNDLIKLEKTDGLFTETEDIRTLYPYPLAINQRGKISPVTPGCQTFLTVIDKDGNKVLDEFVPQYRGTKQFKFAPFYSHNTGKTAVGCSECHGNLYFAGFGQGLVSVLDKSIKSAILCDTCDKPLDAFYYMRNGQLSSTSDIVREKSRPLNSKELKSLFKANQCIVCHDKGDKKIYGSKIDYKILDDCLDRFPPDNNGSN